MSESVSLTEQVACARRELAMRRKAYPRWIQEGRINAARAEHETRAMEAIVKTLEKIEMLNESGIEWITESKEERTCHGYSAEP